MSMKSVVIICIVAVSVLCAVLAVSCGNRQKKSETSGTGAESPFTVEDLRSKRQGMIRAVQRTTVQTPVAEATLVDRRVFHDKKTGVFTVWVLIEAKMDNN